MAGPGRLPFDELLPFRVSPVERAFTFVVGDTTFEKVSRRRAAHALHPGQRGVGIGGREGINIASSSRARVHRRWLSQLHSMLQQWQLWPPAVGRPRQEEQHVIESGRCPNRPSCRAAWKQNPRRRLHRRRAADAHRAGSIVDLLGGKPESPVRTETLSREHRRHEADPDVVVGN